ncbi:MAG: FecR family protein [Bacteroidota bacterium]
MNIIDIISKECGNEDLSSPEKRYLKKWLNASSANRKVYYQLRLSLLLPEEEEIQSKETEVWQDLNSKFKKEDNPGSKNPILIWLRISAVILVAASLIFSVYQLSFKAVPESQVVEIKMVEKVSLAGQKINTVLPDGTKVKLNSGSKLIVPQKFEPNARVVELAGEAFFEVTENKTAPFIVKSGNMQVKVLGTSFNVRAYHEDSTFKVGVRTGKVEVTGIENAEEYKVTLLPNDLSIWNHESRVMSKEKIELADAVFGWIEQKLVFENQSLSSVLKVLSKWYGMKFIDESGISDSSKRRYTAKYKNPTIEQMMMSLAHVYKLNFEINKNENVVTLK